MDNKQKVALQKMISENNIVDNTHKIRENRITQDVQNDIKSFLHLKSLYHGNTHAPSFQKECQKKCPFLFNNHKYILNKLINGTVDMELLTKMLNILKKIEDGEYDQHTGSFYFGNICKQVFLDPVISDNTDTNTVQTASSPRSPPINISWKEYKASE